MVTVAVPVDLRDRAASKGMSDGAQLAIAHLWLLAGRLKTDGIVAVQAARRYATEQQQAELVAGGMVVADPGSASLHLEGWPAKSKRAQPEDPFLEEKRRFREDWLRRVGKALNLADDLSVVARHVGWAAAENKMLDADMRRLGDAELRARATRIWQGVLPWLVRDGMIPAFRDFHRHLDRLVVAVVTPTNRVGGNGDRGLKGLMQTYEDLRNG